MIPMDEPGAAEQSELEALLAFDRALGVRKRTDGEYCRCLCNRFMNASVFSRRCGPEALRRRPHFRTDSGASRLFASWAVAGFGVVFLAEDLVLGRQVRSRYPVPKFWSRPKSCEGSCARRKRPLGSTIRTSFRSTKWARKGPFALSPRRTARG